MKKTLVALSLLFIASSCSANDQLSLYQQAENAVGRRDFRQARKLYVKTVAAPGQMKEREQAAIKLANLEWRVFGDPDAALRALASVDEKSDKYVKALLERARLEGELKGDFARARKTADLAFTAATTEDDRQGSRLAAARAIVAHVLESRACPDASVTEARTYVSQAIAVQGPLIDSVRLLLMVSILSGDGATALEAWESYYGIESGTPTSPSLTEPARILRLLMPQWQGASTPAAQRRDIGLALAGSKLFPEAGLVLDCPCAVEPLPASEKVHDIRVYQQHLAQVTRLTDHYYRSVASGKGASRSWRTAVNKQGQSLYRQLHWPGAVPGYSREALGRELERRFGATITLGETQDVSDMHYGHVVIDEKRRVEQYGRSAEVRFIALDGLVSNGYGTWVSDGAGGDGGWANEEAIYQVRPLYHDGAVKAWRELTDPGMREIKNLELAEAVRGDETTAKATPIAYFRGLSNRLRRQHREALLESLKTAGLKGDDLRDAFLARMRRDVFDSSIWAHEGRHAIDKQYDKLDDTAELEFRAKLSEIALSPVPRLPLGTTIISSEMGGKTPHGKASDRIAGGYVEWMRAHSAEIPRLDRSRPLLIQLDLLTDDQLRAVARSMDPLAKVVSKP